MKILFLTHMLPYPPTDGARIRSFNLLKTLASRHEVSLVSFISETTRQEDIEELRGFVCDLQTVFRPQKYLVKDLLRGVCTSEPFTIINYRSDQMTELVGRKLSEGIEVVHCEHLNMAQYAPAGRGFKRVIDMHNVESEIMRRYAEKAGNPLKALYSGMTAKKLARYERDVLKGFDLCAAVSTRDADHMRAFCLNTVVVDNGVDLDVFIRREKAVDTPKLVYTGWMKYHANNDAARFFCADIFPAIRKNIAEVTVDIVGKEPSEEVLRLGEIDGVNVTGAVPDIRPFISGAAVYIVPLRVGGGTRLKILEAMATGIPIVSTSVGCEGIGLTHEKDILIADSAEEFACQTLRLLGDAPLRQRLAVKARELVEERFSWKMIGEKLLDSYNSLGAGEARYKEISL
ncbi:Glycosyl transferase, group 1 [hydrothermal vent metagenome]|uniref:Glycosyl transferase, group 1 n=1 Tax=hydrothermal vent metagenome TaxID=652676 RepID=A0A3B0RMZ0_9ZZZZ